VYSVFLGFTVNTELSELTYFEVREGSSSSLAMDGCRTKNSPWPLPSASEQVAELAISSDCLLWTTKTAAQGQRWASSSAPCPPRGWAHRSKKGEDLHGLCPLLQPSGNRLAKPGENKVEGGPRCSSRHAQFPPHPSFGAFYRMMELLIFDHEPAACPDCQESQWDPGVH